MKIKYYKMQLTTSDPKEPSVQSQYNVYRISEFIPCCERIQFLPCFDTGFLYDKFSGEKKFSASLRDPVFSDEDGYLFDEFYRIAYCPFCGERIEMEYLGERKPDSELKTLQMKKQSLINHAGNSDSVERYQENVDELRNVIKKISKEYGNNSHKDFVPAYPDKNALKKMRHEAEKDYKENEPSSNPSSVIGTYCKEHNCPWYDMQHDVCRNEKCPYHSGGIVIRLTVPTDEVYDGNMKEAVISGYPGDLVEGLSPKPEIFYYTSAGEEVLTVPSDAGSYVAQVTWGRPEDDITASAEYVIAAKSVTVTALPQTIEEGESISADLSGVMMEGALPDHTLGSVVLTVSDDQIVPSCATITDGTADVSANYEVSYVPGELTVIFRPVYGEPDFVLPTATEAIDESAFEGASMSVVYIPDNCTSIGPFAFKDCSRLSQIRIPEGCVISEDAFDGCEDVCVFGTPGSSAEEYCEGYDYLVFWRFVE